MKFPFKFFLLVSLVSTLLTPHLARAVIPPDFIFNIGSTVIQVFSLIVLFFSAVFGVSYRYLKIRFAKLFASKVFWIVSILILIIGSGAGAFIYASQKEKTAFAVWLQEYRLRNSGSATSTVQYYFYDRLVMSGEDKNHQPFLMFFEGSRQEFGALYGHNYSAEVIYQGTLYRDYTSFTSSSSTFQKNGFVQQFIHTKPNELPEESYTFTLSFEGKDFKVNIPHVGADFLVKNNLEYLRYDSPAQAEITVNGEKIVAQVMVDRVLSTNAPLVTLQAFPYIKNTTHSIVFWDEQNNFYHIDTSKVYTPNVPYYTHTWILYKNTDGTAKQSQTIDIAVHNPKSTAPDWSFTLPEINNARVTLKVNKIIDKNIDGFSGMIEGEIHDSLGTRKVHGYGFYEDKQ
jgi:hypothetical protein